MKPFLFILVLLALSSCVMIPETGKSTFLLTSPEQENQLGTDGYKEVLNKSKLNKDPRLNEILRRVGTRIAAQTSTNFQWEFNIIESKEQNAWCMPGGKVAVYTGILPSMKNEASMAGVLGHEVAHAILRHSGARISRQMLSNVLLQGFTSFTTSSPEQKQTMLETLGVPLGIGLLKYDRGDETEADLVGLKYMAKAGYDPREIISFWQRFGKNAGGAPPEFLSTHPGNSTRIHDLQKNLPEALKLYQASQQKLGIGETLL